MSCEVSWFAALCDDDYEFLGVPDGRLQSSWEHCRDIALGAEQAGYDNLLLPSGYAMGIDSIAFAAGIAPLLRRMQLLVAVRMGEMWPPQLARQLATIDQMLDGRLTINIISSDLPGQSLESAPRYRRTLEIMHILRDLLDGKPVDFRGEFIEHHPGPAAAAPGPRRLPAVLFRRPVRGGPRGRRPGRRRVPDVAGHAGRGRGPSWMTCERAPPATAVSCGSATAPTSSSAPPRPRPGPPRSAWFPGSTTRDRRRRSAAGPWTPARPGTQRQNELRDIADDDGYAEPNLWTGIGRARSGAGAAIVGDPDQVLAKIRAYADLGMDAFILSGYPHAAEGDLFARHVLPHLDHAPLLRG